jgi:hypothetical protein
LFPLFVTYLESDAKKEFIGSGETLSMTSVTIEDAGTYECYAENPINNLAINKVFTITVNGKKNILFSIRKLQYL